MIYCNLRVVYTDIYIYIVYIQSCIHHIQHPKLGWRNREWNLPVSQHLLHPLHQPKFAWEWFTEHWLVSAMGLAKSALYLFQHIALWHDGYNVGLSEIEGEGRYIKILFFKGKLTSKKNLKCPILAETHVFVPMIVEFRSPGRLVHHGWKPQNQNETLEA